MFSKLAHSRRSLILGAVFVVLFFVLTAQIVAILPMLLKVWKPFDYRLYVEMGTAVRQGQVPYGLISIPNIRTEAHTPGKIARAYIKLPQGTFSTPSARKVVARDLLRSAYHLSVPWAISVKETGALASAPYKRNG
mgnify:CR=1 FL=1